MAPRRVQYLAAGSKTVCRHSTDDLSHECLEIRCPLGWHNASSRVGQLSDVQHKDVTSELAGNGIDQFCRLPRFLRPIYRQDDLAEHPTPPSPMPLRMPSDPTLPALSQPNPRCCNDGATVSPIGLAVRQGPLSAPLSDSPHGCRAAALGDILTVYEGSWLAVEGLARAMAGSALGRPARPLGLGPWGMGTDRARVRSGGRLAPHLEQAGHGGDRQDHHDDAKRQ
jgi:hypothetical protein